MYDDQDRPPWLRNLRTPRPEAESELETAAPAAVEPVDEPGALESPAGAEEGVRGAISRQQLLLLAILLWGNVTILGCLCLLATGTVVP
jgi:hypothetical protein